MYRDAADKSSASDRSSTLEEQPRSGDGVFIQEKSRGVRQMERLSERIDLKYSILLYGGFAVLAYVMSLDQYTAGTYLTTATSVSFAAHSTLATIRAIKSVFQAVSQPPIAKLADVAGRIEAYVTCVFLYALGYIIVASANSIYVYAVGNSIYILGITGLFLLQNIIIADISSLRNRLFWSIFPSLPGTINVWVSGDVAQGVLRTSTWRWGIGMFCILTPALATPILLTLMFGMRKAKKSQNQAIDVKPQHTRRSVKSHAREWFWQLDFIGLLLFVAGSGLVLVAITLSKTGGTSKWSDAHSIAMLVVGGVSCIAFVLWERFGARHPLIPFSLLTNRTVIVAFVIAVLHPAAGSIIGGYFYTFLLVAANQSVKSATRITNIASFSGTICAALAGIGARYIRYLKPVIIFGFSIEVLALGLMIRYRRSTNSQVDLALVQVLRGLGSGCIGFPTQAAIQSAAKHEHTAAITAAYLTIYYLSGGIGAAIGGGIWTSEVPEKINSYLSWNSTLAASAYSNPVGFIARYGIATPERQAISRAHDETQRIIVIVGTCVAACGLIAACFLENVRLPDTQSRPEIEEGGEDFVPANNKKAVI